MNPASSNPAQELAPTRRDVSDNIGGVMQAAGAEKDPREADEAERDRQRPARAQPWEALNKAGSDFFPQIFGKNPEAKINPIQCAPNDIRPVCAVPKPANQEDNHEVAIELRVAHAIATQRKINVIP